MQRVWFYQDNFNKTAVERQVKVNVELSHGDLVWLRGLSCHPTSFTPLNRLVVLTTVRT